MHVVFEHTFSDGTIFRINQDPDPPDPRVDYDNACRMICFHRRRNLGDKHEYKTSAELIASEEGENSAIMSPLFAYEHGGISISLSRDGQFSDPWDSGQVGWTIVSKETLEKEWGGDRSKAYDCMAAEVDTYNRYLNGEIYGFELIKVVKCEHCGHGEEQHGDSCWGFYGDDPFDNGMVEHLSESQQAELAKVLKKPRAKPDLAVKSRKEETKVEK